MTRQAAAVATFAVAAAAVTALVAFAFDPLAVSWTGGEGPRADVVVEADPDAEPCRRMRPSGRPSPSRSTRLLRTFAVLSSAVGSPSFTQAIFWIRKLSPS